MPEERTTPLRERMTEGMRMHGTGDKTQKAYSSGQGFCAFPRAISGHRDTRPATSFDVQLF